MQSIEGPLGIGRAYHIRWTSRLGWLFAFVVTIGVSAELFGRVRDGIEQSTLWVCFLITLLPVVIGVLALGSLYNRVTLYSNAIEYRNVWSTSWLQFGEIRGRREYLADLGRGGKVPHLLIVPNDDNLPFLDFAKGYNFDDAFWAWFNRLPDLKKVSQSARR